ncbi:L,D-transpeptidase family protein [Lysobacter solisilvae (ex Woo and Kim 2022)]|uniref:L,D-transpeptidase family protein n=1 Tax=Agrilutibacter terrestris TaxID=2865112 RepID=A0A7H0FWU8_9GAMM|nr:L,D-transpeptidase family protein [Lysobacter terrestris]QNP40514.1 L,D-transpeptidase family protein [Lysobacter terrestris]
MKIPLMNATFIFFALGCNGSHAREPDLLPKEQRATRILVDKSDRLLTLYRDDAVIAQYRVRLGANPEGDKVQYGDERTPEGNYEIDSKNAESKFHLGLHISYPNAQDRSEAEDKKVDPGGAIMIHGGNAWWRPFNWTDGCIAVSNREIEEIWKRVGTGTPVTIVP